MAKSPSVRKSIIDSIDDIDMSSEHPDDGGKLSAGPGRESFKLAQFWKSQINMHDQATRKYVKRGNGVVKRYRDERNRIDEEGQRRMNLLWSNIKVMKPAIYSRCPQPVVDRKFLDRDPTARLSAQILERTLVNELEDSGFHAAMNMAVMDRLLPGRGIVWARYVPKIGSGVSIPAPTQNGVEDELYKIGKEFDDKALTEDTEKEDALDQSGEQVLDEKVEIDYVDWRDLYLLPVKARVWREVQAVGKVVHISKKEAIERFGPKIGKALKPDTEPILLGNTERQNTDMASFQDINQRNITIYEVWNKSDRRAYWFSTGYDYLCDVQEDPLELREFFPVPPPLMATTTNDTLIPVPDYIEWQDQAIQIDELTQRIAMLSKACKVAGAYNASFPTINRIFGESIENELIPVDQWAMFAEAGGLKGVMDFIPIDVIQSCIETLQKVRQQAMIDLDQVTGLSDVIRGTSDSRETLGGLRIKNNNAGTRLSESQEDVARFARDVIRLMAEIACKHFSEETLIESSGILYEDALQPDTILRELNKSTDQQTPKPQQPSQQPSPSPQAPALQPPSGQPGMPTAAPPQAPQPQTNNVVPFPGSPQGGALGAQGAPQSPMMGMGMQPQQPDPSTIAMMKVLDAIKLLRQDVTRGYRIDIETDSTIFGDKEQDKENANEFLVAVGGYMKQLEALSNVPEAMPLFAKALQWGVRRYRTGRDLEAEIDTFCETMAKKAKQLIENPPESPEDKKAKAEINAIQMEAQSQKQNDDRAAQMQQQNDQREFKIQQAKDQREAEQMQMEMQLQREQNNMEIEKMRMEMTQKRQEHLLAMREMTMKMQMSVQEHKLDAESQAMDIHHQKEELKVDKQGLEHKKKEGEQKHQMKLKQQKEQHKQAMKPKKKAS